MKWNENKGKKYLTTIVIYSNTRENRLLDLIQKDEFIRCAGRQCHFENRGDDAIYEMDVYVRDTNHVNRLILDLEKLPYILKGRKDYQIMRVLVQKCRNASVSVSGKIVGRCDFWSHASCRFY